MAHEMADFDATLAAAAGDDPMLLDELRAAFAESLAQQVDLLRRARCDANWEMAARRLTGLGSSFNVSEVVELAREATDGAPGDPAVLRKLAALCDRFISRQAG